MNIKINIATKQIELLDHIPFDDAKKLVDALIAAYGWEAKDVRIKSVTEIVAGPAPIFIERRPYYEPWLPYVTWCGGTTVTGLTSTDCTTSGTNSIENLQAFGATFTPT